MAEDAPTERAASIEVWLDQKKKGLKVRRRRRPQGTVKGLSGHAEELNPAQSSREGW